MDSTESKKEHLLQAGTPGKPSTHFLSAALGNTHAVQNAAERHCPDELAFWMGGGYSVHKTPGIPG